MPFPSPGWPPRPASGRRSARMYQNVSIPLSGATTPFGDHAFLFIDVAGANMMVPLPYVEPGSTVEVDIGDIDIAGSPVGTGMRAEDAAPPEHENPPATQQQVNYHQLWANSIRIYNEGPNAIEFSFDGVNVHGYIAVGQAVTYKDRYEAGISIRRIGAAGVANIVHVEAW